MPPQFHIMINVHVMIAYYKNTFRCLILIIASTMSSLSIADSQEINALDSSSETDLTSLLQKLTHLSKKNEQLKRRLSIEIRKHDSIIAKILKLASNVELKFDNATQMNLAGNAITEDDFYNLDDSLLRKCSSITKSVFNREDLQERQYNKNLFESEAFDSDWTSEVSSGINEHLTRRFPNTQMLSIECRTSICEINLKHDNEIARDDFNMNFDPEHKWNLIDSQSRNDVRSSASFITIQIAHDGQIISQN